MGGVEVRRLWQQVVVAHGHATASQPVDLSIQSNLIIYTLYIAPSVHHSISSQKQCTDNRTVGSTPSPAKGLPTQTAFRRRRRPGDRRYIPRLCSTRAPDSRRPTIDNPTLRPERGLRYFKLHKFFSRKDTHTTQAFARIGSYDAPCPADQQRTVISTLSESKSLGARPRCSTV